MAWVENDENSFQKSFKIVLIVAQCFALMPVDGITADKPSKLRFNWLSIRVFYSIFAILGSLFFTTCMGMIFAKEKKFSFHGSITGVVFFATTGSIIIMFFNLARHWPKLCCEWAEVELAMKDYVSPYRLKKRIKYVFVTMISLAVVEHILFLVHICFEVFSHDYEGNPLRFYFTFNFKLIFDVISFSWIRAIIVQTLNTEFTFWWNFMDCFITLIGIALNEKLLCISNRIKSTQKKSEVFWRTVRQDYNRITNLCKTVNRTISHIIFASFFINLYFICIQLLGGIKRPPDIVTGIYFFYSFFYLIGRTLSVILWTAEVYEENQSLTRLLFSNSEWTDSLEIRRLIEQVTLNEMALTGLNFFKIRRGLILTIASSIATYELVCIQYEQSGAAIQEVINATSEAT